jgi:ribonuclease E
VNTSAAVEHSTAPVLHHDAAPISMQQPAVTPSWTAEPTPITPPISSPVVAATPVAPPVEHVVATQHEVLAETPVQNVVAAPAPVEPAYNPPPAPKIDTSAMLSSAGLQMVETVIKPSAPIVEEQPVRLGRPRRERQRMVAEPLQQVETARSDQTPSS